MDRNRAAEEFARMLFREGVEEGIKSFFGSLDHPVGEHKQKWAQVKQWYEGGTEETKEFIRFIVKESMVVTAFRLAVHFDGAAGYVFAEERPAEFAVVMNIYRSLDEAKSYSPQETIEVCPTRHGEDVHDIFLDLVEKSE